MLAQLEKRATPATSAEAKRARHLLVVLPKADATGVPFADVLNVGLERRKKKRDELAKAPLTTDLPHALVGNPLPCLYN